jgi:mannose-6-phosphate isomerase
MDLLENTVQPYAWGSREALARLMGRAVPSPGPEAELWIGAHPVAPSRVSRGGAKRPLDLVIAEAPEAALGPAVAARFGHKLPFLLKVLAAAEPLSLQAHPSLEQARAGFAREEALGLARSAPHRNYKDDNHKPELLVALTHFEALCGFRTVAGSRALLEGLRVPALAPHLALLAHGDAKGLKAFFTDLMTLEPLERGALAEAVAEACAKRPVKGFERECRWGATLAAKYPGDVGLLGALLLNVVTLEPMEALFLPAGQLHAYLSGTGVEIMASSDNVLRGGLTPKHVDVKELVAVLDFQPGPVPVRRPTGAPEAVYETPTQEFRLSRCEVNGSLGLAHAGPEVLLCTEGEVTVRATETASLRSGQAVFVAASDPAPVLEGRGVVFRATVGA